MGVIWVDMGVIWVDTGVIWGNMGSYGGQIGVSLGENVPHFFGICLGTPPPLFSITLGHKKMCSKVLVRVETPPPLGKFPEKNRFFFWMASLSNTF